MKFICTADWHIRATKPRCRIDENWIETQANALRQLAEISNEKNAPIFVVGDLFHSNSDTSFECINIVQKLADFSGGLYVLAGNHDLPYHSSENIDKSAIGILLNSESVFKIEDFFENTVGFEDIDYSASNFDEEDNENAKIVFKHTLVFPDAKSMPPNVNAKTAQDLLNDFPKAKWIFTGDMHKNFHYVKNGRHVVNPGCLIREVSDMKDYQTGVYFVDTEKEEVEFIPIEDDVKLVDDSYITVNNEREERIENFVSKLKNAKTISLNFTENVDNAILENSLSEELKDTIRELMEV